MSSITLGTWNHSDRLQLSVTKLISLWAFSECAMGGLLHAFKVPFSGIVLASFAVIIILNIGLASPAPVKDILYGTLVALAVKAAVSPHSPVAAYVAVSFQGMLGALIFMQSSRQPAIFLLFGLLALLESALQKVLLITIFYGNPFWEAIDSLVVQLVGYFVTVDQEWSVTYYALWIYLLVYSLVGMMAGLWGYKISDWIQHFDNRAIEGYTVDRPTVKKKKKKAVRWLFFFIAMLILVLYISTLSGGWQKNWWIVMRPVLFIALWYFIGHPVMKWLVRRFFSGHSSQLTSVVTDITNQIPLLTSKASIAWRYAADNFSGLRRLRQFIVLLIVLTCAVDSNHT